MDFCSQEILGRSFVGLLNYTVRFCNSGFLSRTVPLSRFYLLISYHLLVIKGNWKHTCLKEHCLWQTALQDYLWRIQKEILRIMILKIIWCNRWRKCPSSPNLPICRSFSSMRVEGVRFCTRKLSNWSQWNAFPICLENVLYQRVGCCSYAIDFPRILHFIVLHNLIWKKKVEIWSARLRSNLYVLMQVI